MRDWLGDRALLGLTALASLAAIVVMVAIVLKVFGASRLAFDKFGIAFLWGRTWDATHDVYGALPGLFGTAVTSLMALVIAVPLAIAIALFLSELAPRGVGGIVGALVETLAAVPSVVLGLWGILVLGPFAANHLEPWLHDTLGFIPLFSGTPQSSGIFIAGLVLAIMVVPIVASICRELFLSVPHELEEGALALGATRWEMVRGVVLSSSRPGIAAAVILGLGRAIGEAIAVTQVIGAGWTIQWSLFSTGDTLASRIAGQYQGAVSKMQVSALFYLGAILLVIGLVTNFLAQLVVRRAVAADGWRLMSSLEPTIDLRGRGGRTRRRRLMNRLAELLALLAALVAVAVLGIVVWSVAKRGASQLSIGFLTKDLPRLRPAGRRDRAADRRLRDPGRHRRPDRRAGRRADRDLHERVRLAEAASRDPARDRPDERPALDRDRDLRLRAARLRTPAERARGLVRPGDRDAPAGHARHPGGAPPRAEQPAGRRAWRSGRAAGERCSASSSRAPWAASSPGPCSRSRARSARRRRCCS